MSPKDLKTVIQLAGLFSDYETWTGTKRKIRDLMCRYLTSGVHEYFISHSYLHGRYVGDYYIEKADHKRRGRLFKYRGKKVIVMCIGNGFFHEKTYLLAVVE